jgi:hypothetical protein
MGKSWKERPNKWRHQINKQKKNRRPDRKPEWERIVDTLADEQDRYDRSIGGPNDYAYGM